ncbi:unnamed protein product [Trifolium pratense]|uniref:Uncharacterized protein n=1 Tax=Trifolium pratense TaxID=57577 RepID=A0ACB0J3K4_TRIPR|nr:unnamed protein product [Trifolium pratense]
MNLQPSEAEAGFDIRVPPTADTESLERRIAEEWAPSWRNMSFRFQQKVSVYDASGKPVITKTDSSNPWWALLENAVQEAGGKLGKPEIFPASTDARYFRNLGLPAIGFSPMANTPILLHDHNETRRQPNGNDCGYYVMKNMLDIVTASITKNWMEVFDDLTSLTEEELYELRNSWATCFLDLYNPEVDYDVADDEA